MAAFTDGNNTDAIEENRSCAMMTCGSIGPCSVDYCDSGSGIYGYSWFSKKWSECGMSCFYAWWCRNGFGYEDYC